MNDVYVVNRDLFVIFISLYHFAMLLLFALLLLLLYLVKLFPSRFFFLVFVFPLDSAPFEMHHNYMNVDDFCSKQAIPRHPVICSFYSF